ncbi:MAG: hypothetical protein ACOYJU_04075 [Anaerovoracaceae bacterium]
MIEIFFFFFGCESFEMEKIPGTAFPACRTSGKNPVVTRPSRIAFKALVRLGYRRKTTKK